MAWGGQKILWFDWHGEIGLSVSPYEKSRAENYYKSNSCLPNFFVKPISTNWKWTDEKWEMMLETKNEITCLKNAI